MSAPMFIAELFTITKAWKLCKYTLTDKWIKSIYCVCVYRMKYYSAIKNNEIIPFGAT